MAEIAIIDVIVTGIEPMKTMSARDAKNAFGLLLDTARAEPVTIEKHGRRVVVVMAVEEYHRLIAAPRTDGSSGGEQKEGRDPDEVN